MDRCVCVSQGYTSLTDLSVITSSCSLRFTTTYLLGGAFTYRGPTWVDHQLESSISLFPPYMVGSQLSHPSPTSISVILRESCSLYCIIMITVEIDPAHSVPHLTECAQSFLSLPRFNDELLSFQSPNMYELRSARLIRCLVYDVTRFT